MTLSDFSNLVRLLKSKKSLSIISFLSVVVILLFLSSHLGLHSWRLKIIIVVTMLVFYGLIIIARYYWMRSRGGRLHRHLQQQTERAAGRVLEIALLKEKMATAVKSLKASALGTQFQGKAALYALPWFMVIGPSAAGKSTLLRHSGLHFCATDGDDIRVKGFGGTRNCDWWFANEAILLDTAGRYTTEEDDHDEWLTFLNCLKKYRRRLPINGIIVVMSLVELLTTDSQGIQHHIDIIKARATELNERLGHVFPIYLIFSKYDLLQGFDDFFHTMTAMEREQVWGINLNSKKSGEFDSVLEYQLEQIYTKLLRIRTQQLLTTNNIEEKRLIYNFPQQFKESTKRVVNFVEQLSEVNPYQENINICGVYFTSSHQAGKTIECVVANGQQQFEYSDSKGKTLSDNDVKSFFVKKLFNSVIFTNQYLSYRSQKKIVTWRGIKFASIIASLACLMVAFLLFSTSLTSNILLLNRGVSSASKLASTLNNRTVDFGEKLKSLIAVYQFYRLLNTNKKDIPFHLRLGLYRGDTQVKSLRALMLSTLSHYYLAMMGRALTTELNKDIKKWSSASKRVRSNMRGNYYMALKYYLMLTHPNRLNLSLVKPNVQKWQYLISRKTLYNFSIDDLSSMVTFYWQYLKSHPYKHQLAGALPVNANLINKARVQLYLADNSLNLYSQLKSSGLQSLGYLQLSDVITGQGSNLLRNDYALPILYTRQGWRDYMHPAITQLVNKHSLADWVISMPLAKLNSRKLKFKADVTSKINSSVSHLNFAIRQDYFRDYVNAWLQFISSMRVTPFVSLHDASEQLAILSYQHGPVMQFCQLLLKNIAIFKQHQMIPELYEPFSGLRHALSNNSQKQNIMSHYLSQLHALQNDIDRLDFSVDKYQASLDYAQNILNNKGGSSQLYLTRLAVLHSLEQLHDPLERQAFTALLMAPVKQTWQVIVNNAAHKLNTTWKSNIISDYQRNIQNTFPFNSQGVDANIDDVSYFFEPQHGTLWQFIHSMKNFMTFNGQVWRGKQWLGIGINFSAPFLNTIKRAQVISHGLFSANGLTFKALFYPIPTPGIAQTIISTNNFYYRYRNGPEQWQLMKIIIDDNQELSLNMLLANNDTSQSINFSGAWGIFHLLKKANIKPLSQHRYQLTWRVPDDHHLAIRMIMKFSANDDLLKALVKTPFSLPNRITKSSRL